MHLIRYVVGFCALALLGCGAAPRSHVIAIENVAVLAMDPDATPRHDQTVLLRGDRILTLGPAAEVDVPRGARRISGRGKWLVPGFTDMHAHPENAAMVRALTGVEDIPASDFRTDDVYLPFIVHGITQVLSAAGTAETLAQRDAIARGEALGPHLFVAAMIDGESPIWPAAFSHPVATPEEARARVRKLLAEGYDFIKTYTRLDPASFAAIVDEVAEADGRLIGHLPGRGRNATEAFAGLELVMHAEEFAYQAESVEQGSREISRYAEFARRHDIGLVATLVVDVRILEQMRDPASLSNRTDLAFVSPHAHPFWFDHNPYAGASPARIAAVEEVARFNRLLVKTFADAGIAIFPGTDANIPGVVSGTSLHEEFEALIEAGMTEAQVLRAATRDAAVWLGVGEDRGTIEPGRRADLVLLNADPLVDIRNTRDIAAVVVGGRVLERPELDAKMADLVRRYAEMASSR